MRRGVLADGKIIQKKHKILNKFLAHIKNKFLFHKVHKDIIRGSSVLKFIKKLSDTMKHKKTNGFSVFQQESNAKGLLACPKIKRKTYWEWNVREGTKEACQELLRT